MLERAMLLVDAGNTRVKWRFDDAGGEAVCSGAKAWCDESFDELFAGLGQMPSVIAVASVASQEKSQQLKSLLALRFTGLASTWFEMRQGLGGIHYAYNNVTKLGLDRALAMVAARAMSQDAVMVIDCGSAITADLVTGNGKHIGGYIFPGIALLRESLKRGTANVGVADAGFGDLEPGCDTEECVEHAINLMLVASIKDLLGIARSYEINSVLLTGGDAECIKKLGCFDIDVCADLVLDGLRYVHKDG